MTDYDRLWQVRTGCCMPIPEPVVRTVPFGGPGSEVSGRQRTARRRVVSAVASSGSALRGHRVRDGFDDVSAAFADPRLDEFRGCDDQVRPTCGEPHTSRVVDTTVAVPLDDQQSACERRPPSGHDNLTRRLRGGVKAVARRPESRPGPRLRGRTEGTDRTRPVSRGQFRIAGSSRCRGGEPFRPRRTRSASDRQMRPNG